ncbi:hypothetical protein GcLGCM259_1798 [Glutamicibacter creatinolyticus]|uniref:Ig-like domain-containing protein n=1 Tax=Glutamicibacter creatinolyticus TaxID=162496 RepID=A0A5B7WTU3_9MICC|nr:hypothetical protein [Glutamicibacter creatinolyticus]QCY47516.1 hypothetical protein GcLGCM259_1798 [Glutamicibacter creatinolyticus]
MTQHTQPQLSGELAKYSDIELTTELFRRAEQREHEAAVARATVILRDMPEVLDPKWTVNKLCAVAVEHGLPATATFAAWEKLTTKPASKSIPDVLGSNAFQPGDRVAFSFDCNATGTVTTVTDQEVRVKWDDCGLETPTDPAELVAVA